MVRRRRPRRRSRWRRSRPRRPRPRAAPPATGAPAGLHGPRPARARPRPAGLRPRLAAAGGAGRHHELPAEPAHQRHAPEHARAATRRPAERRHALHGGAPAPGRRSLVLHVPPTGGRYFTMQLLDAYTNSFAYVGRRTTGSGATDVAIAGPGWRGSVPHGVRLVRSPTPVVWLLGRTLVDGPADLPAVNALQQGYALRRSPPSAGPPLASLSIPSSTLHPRPSPPAWPSSTRSGPRWREPAPAPRPPAAGAAAPRRIGPGLRTSRRHLGAATRAACAPRRGGARPGGRLRGPPAARLGPYPPRLAAPAARRSATPAATSSCAPSWRGPPWAPTSVPRRSTPRRTPTAAGARSTARTATSCASRPGSSRRSGPSGR